MTKAKMIEAIQEAEATAWMEYNRFSYLFAPTDKGYKGACDWQSEDPNARRLRSVWSTLSDLMETLGIEPTDNDTQRLAWEYHSQLYKACKEAE